MNLWKWLFGSSSSDKARPDRDSAPAAPSAHHPPSDPPPGTAGASASARRRDPTNPPATRSASPDPVSAAPDRVIRVFLSSTFRDMVEERNELMAQVWPALRKLCRERAVEFVEVDLRWGVTEEQAQRQETLRHCLAEIKRCRPYFLGLLGERYGWTPGPEAFTPALLAEEDWLQTAVAQHSITELEILHGVLNDPAMAGRAFFYFRDPHYAAAKGGNYQAEDAVQAARQQALKEKVKAVCAAQGIPLREHYADPHALAARVLADLTPAIEAQFPRAQVPDAWPRGPGSKGSGPSSFSTRSTSSKTGSAAGGWPGSPIACPATCA